MNECIFCKIAKKEIKSKIIYEDSDIIAFNDTSPQAPVHVIIIPKAHKDSIIEMESSEDYKLISKIFEAVNKIAEKEGLVKEGFRIVLNYGESGGQAIPHLHFHLLAGRKFSWPPG